MTIHLKWSYIFTRGIIKSCHVSLNTYLNNLGPYKSQKMQTQKFQC